MYIRTYYFLTNVQTVPYCISRKFYQQLSRYTVPVHYCENATDVVFLEYMVQYYTHIYVRRYMYCNVRKIYFFHRI